MDTNPCKWHEVPIRNCLTCNGTKSNVYHIPDTKEENEEIKQFLKFIGEENED